MASKNKQKIGICPVKEVFMMKFDGEEEERSREKDSISAALGACVKYSNVWDFSEGKHGGAHWTVVMNCMWVGVKCIMVAIPDECSQIIPSVKKKNLKENNKEQSLELRFPCEQLQVCYVLKLCNMVVGIPSAFLKH